MHPDDWIIHLGMVPDAEVHTRAPKCPMHRIGKLGYDYGADGMVSLYCSMNRKALGTTPYCSVGAIKMVEAETGFSPFLGDSHRCLKEKIVISYCQKQRSVW